MPPEHALPPVSEAGQRTVGHRDPAAVQPDPAAGHRDPAESPWRAFARDLASGAAPKGWLSRRLDPVDARVDLADHRLLPVVKLYLSASDLLPDDMRERIEKSVLGFKYHWSEQGSDGMCTWSETHQLLFAACEHLMGRRLAARVFLNDGRTGKRKAERARRHLMAWLDDRFRFGYSEWLSSTYYELDVVGLSLLADHADDELATRAAMVLDLTLFDMALHRFDGELVATAGRAYAKQKARPSRAEVAVVLREAFEGPQPFDPEQLSAVFVGRDRYVVPPVLHEVAEADGEQRIRASYGRDVRETIRDIERRPGLDATERRQELARSLWSMEAFTTSRSIGPTMAEFAHTHLAGNRFVAALAPYVRVAPRLLPAMVRLSNPIQQGAALQRADVHTYRTPHYLLSSVQHYQVGRFGHQQHLWVAGLPGGISVFATHPGSTRLDDGSGRPATPSAWVGNGINPDIAQVDNVLLALHDTSGRVGLYEGRRHDYTHLHFPFARFDETRVGDRFVVGRRGDAFIAVASVHRLEQVSEVEVVQRGHVTGWAVMVADRGNFGSLSHLVEFMRRHPLRLHGVVLEWTLPEHRHELSYRNGLRIDGVTVPSRYPRYATQWAHVPRDPSSASIVGRRHALRLDWTHGVRALEELDRSTV